MSVTLWCNRCGREFQDKQCVCGGWLFTSQRISQHTTPALTGVMTPRESDSPIPDPASVPPEEDP